jgi:glycosyltransferase involved in cell wall biosynthesis
MGRTDAGSLRQLSAEARSWHEATSVGNQADWFAYPYVGAPWDHACGVLRSDHLSVSVIIPVWNSAISIHHCLEAISHSSLNRLAPTRVEVIVCDDGSTDGSWEQVVDGRFALNLTAIRLEHRSQSAALNAGLIHANGDIVAFCDSDIIMGCGALDELAARHERWRDAVCFGFRSNINADQLEVESIWQLMHREAFSADNRVSFDLPTLVPNMLDANDWLSRLSAGRFMLDSQGHEWRRHRFVYGCLFSATRGQVVDCGGFPDVLNGWGFGDTLMAARLEANGSFLMPVASAWGHHVEHDLRHPEQWFQMHRNDLAYRYILDQVPNQVTWHVSGDITLLDEVTHTRALPSAMKPRSIEYGHAAFYGLGRWSECLDLAEAAGAHEVVTESLYRLGRLEDAAQSEAGDRSVWGALSHHQLGNVNRAKKTLETCMPEDLHATYALTASPPELLFLADHYKTHGMADTSRMYVAMAEVRSAQDGRQGAER